MNLGLRYEYNGPPTERNNYMGNFNPNVNPATTPAIQQVGPGEPLPSLYNSEYNDDFSPRLGVAWDVRGNGKTVVRAGVSLLTDFTDLQSSVRHCSLRGEYLRLPWLRSAQPNVVNANTSGTVANAHTPDMLDSSAAAQLNAGWNTTGPIFPHQHQPDDQRRHLYWVDLHAAG